jgi:hypothetical protein
MEADDAVELGGRHILRAFEFAGMTVHAACAPCRAELSRGPSAGEQTDHTGFVPWLACQPLCEYLAAGAGAALLEPDARVVELGAGVGLPGLLAGRRVSELCLTDAVPAVIAQLRASIAAGVAAGELRGAAATAALLEWGDGPLPAGLREGGYDLVLASDCVYYEGESRAPPAPAFAQSARAALRDSPASALVRARYWRVRCCARGCAPQALQRSW